MQLIVISTVIVIVSITTNDINYNYFYEGNYMGYFIIGMR